MSAFQAINITMWHLKLKALELSSGSSFTRWIISLKLKQEFKRYSMFTEIEAVQI